MENWTLLTNHAQVLLAIARDPGIRLRDIAAILGITERSAYAIVTDLAGAGYVVKDKDTDGRRNRYQIQAHLPLPETIGRERTIGEVLDVLVTKPVGLAAALTGDARQNRPPDHGDPPCPSSARKDAPGAVSRTGGVNHIIRLPV